MRAVTLRLGDVESWLVGEAPGPGAILGHVAGTGHGRAWADAWPRASALLVEVGGNYLLAGEPDAVDPAVLRPLVTGFLAAPPEFAPVVAAAFPRRVVWDRVIHRLAAPAPAQPGDKVPDEVPDEVPVEVPVEVRPLVAADAEAVARLSPELAWIAKTWGGPAGLAEHGHGFGAFADGRLAALVCTFFQGFRHEDAGVVTEPQWRRRGLATACARAWAADVVARGRTPTWSTSPDNEASWRIPERLGFELVRRDVLYVVGVDVPT